jgi:hypothetical protein
MQVIHDNFLALKAHLAAQILTVRTVDLWNEQLAFATEEHPIICPAVYIEYLPVEWAKVGETLHGTATIVLHIVRNTVADTYTIDGNVADNISEAMKRFATAEAVRYLAEGWQHATCKKLQLSGSSTDHNHDGYSHDTLSFTTTLLGNTSNANNGYVMGVLPPVVVMPNTVPATAPANTGFTIP